MAPPINAMLAAPILVADGTSGANAQLIVTIAAPTDAVRNTIAVFGFRVSESAAAAAIVAVLYGERGTAKLLIFSQVILSLQLSFAVFPLVRFTSDREKMGEFVNSIGLRIAAYVVAGVIATLNIWLLFQTIRGWIA